RKRRSLSQRRRSTSSSCMMAICPAGPPKLMNPSLSQKRSACQKGTGGGVSVERVESLMEGPWCVGSRWGRVADFGGQGTAGNYCATGSALSDARSPRAYLSDRSRPVLFRRGAAGRLALHPATTLFQRFSSVVSH